MLMQIVVNGLMTHFQRQGTGKTVLLLHGWGDRLETFAELTRSLSKKYDVISLDLPGFGQTQAPDTVWDLDDYANFTATFLAKLEQPTVYAVVGHSNGGALAIRAVATGQLKPTKLVLLAASGVRDTAKLRRAGLKVIAKTGKVATFWLPTTTKKKLQKKLYGAAGSDMLVAPHLQETFKRTVRQDIQKDARKIAVPTLLIYGDSDKATPLDSVGNVLKKQITGARLSVVKDADHFVHHTATEEVSKDVLEFLA